MTMTPVPTWAPYPAIAPRTTQADRLRTCHDVRTESVVSGSGTGWPAGIGGTEADADGTHRIWFNDELDQQRRGPRSGYAQGAKTT
jgi:hypothetical protein